jgi:hypothetical protein
MLSTVAAWAEALTTWRSLRTWGNSKIVNSSFVWLAIVPVFAKFTSDLDNQIAIQAYGQALVFNLKLPFSWLCFYYGALLFGFAQVVFLLRCPPLIRQFEDFGEFERSGRGGRQLLKFCYAEDLRDVVLSIVPKEWHNPLDSNFNANKGYWGVTFFAAQDRLDLRHPRSRVAIAICYAIGFGLWSWVFLQQVTYVLKATLAVAG